MEVFGIDILVMFFIFCFVVFWGTMFVAFTIFLGKNPYFPRKYFPVVIEDKDGNRLKTLKGWIMKEKGVPFFRVGLRNRPATVMGFQLDVAVLETADKDGVVTLIQSVDGREDAGNFTPKNVPITQREKFIGELLQNVDDASKPVFELKVREALAKHSRLSDLNTSATTKSYVSQARREAERDKSNDLLAKYGWLFAILMVCVFVYLIMDGGVKGGLEATRLQANALHEQSVIMENGYAQVVHACGGVFIPYNMVKNDSLASPTAKAENILPFG